MAASEIALRQELEVVNGTVAALATFAKNPLAEARLLEARQTKRRLQVEISQRKPDQERVVILRDRVIPGKEKAIAELQSRIVNLRASLETEHSPSANSSFAPRRSASPLCSSNKRRWTWRWTTWRVPVNTLSGQFARKTRSNRI
jgi:hypothetical protein